MRERVINFFQNLPPEGIGIHGTNLSRALSIKEYGFQQQLLLNGQQTSSVWYCVQPPNIGSDPGEVFNGIRRHLKEAGKYAIIRSESPNYHLGTDATDTKPALVVFRPKKPFDRSLLWFHSAPYSQITSDTTPISNKNILGVIEFDINSKVIELVPDVVKIVNKTINPLSLIT